MKQGDRVICVDWLGASEWLRPYGEYTVERVVGFMDAVEGSTDAGVFYGNMESVERKGVIIEGVFARYDCGGRMAFRADRFRVMRTKNDYQALSDYVKKTLPSCIETIERLYGVK